MCHHRIGISYRKIPQVIHEMFGVTFTHGDKTPAALIGFEKLLATCAEPIVEDIAKKLGSSEGAVHADETYSTLTISSPATSHQPIFIPVRAVRGKVALIRSRESS